MIEVHEKHIIQLEVFGFQNVHTLCITLSCSSTLLARTHLLSTRSTIARANGNHSNTFHTTV